MGNQEVFYDTIERVIDVIHAYWMNKTGRTVIILLPDVNFTLPRLQTWHADTGTVYSYSNGEDYVGRHSDNEPELGEQPYIASLTLGAARRFSLRHKKTSESNSLILANGDLRVMDPNFQHHWQHSIPLGKNVTAERINLTLRNVISTKVEEFHKSLKSNAGLAKSPTRTTTPK